ncbi:MULTISPECIES: serine hydrolase domain-containing protein [Sphingobium]|uniref:serine hydrolase domain-containing protein n=1 Tax=Sphingobium TaxID=165695 RepID=UPI0015EBD5E2|nr:MULTISPECIES: serine hydrolase domain-containing protein [Sphingobium]MCW2362365.1 CubicO group peptidase (beta-lactamase class C family) [Sphingobium sp. B10D3B]MCW2400956.1 CubicO group peptidase (beta-lactamase class C family) [Sphingobium sp. B10D7B]MCW2407935.1 CubicO group peptidase (beta-lactamase class C family) [Sphingobium xanthum]
MRAAARLAAGALACLWLTATPLAAKAGAAAEAVAPTDALAALRAGLQAMVDARELPNAQAVIVKDGRERLRVSIGKLDLEAGRVLPADAIFRLYSMTKPITSVAVMMLVEEGKIAIDAPLSRYMPEFADLRVYKSGSLDAMVTEPLNRPVTIGDLLTHSSGVTYNFTGNGPVQQYYRRHGVMRAGGVGQNADDAPPARTMDELIARLAKAPLLHQPGARFSYGNSTGILGALIERVTGQGLDAFLQARIFDPLEMTDTRFVVDDARATRLVTNYAAVDGGLQAIEPAATSEYRDPARPFDGGGALAGTLHDYLNFAQMLANRGAWHGKRLLRPETVDQMFQPRLETGGQPHENVLFGYGLGLGDAVSEQRGGMPAGAGGWSGSANSYFFVHPGRNLVAIVMTNVLVGPALVDRTIRLRGLVDQAAQAVLAEQEPAIRR